MNNTNVNDVKNFDDAKSKNVDSVTKLFEKTSIFKSLNKVVFLAIVVSLATGIYVFVDQILMVRVLPLNTNWTNSVLSEWQDTIKLINDNNININTSVSSIIRTAVSLSSPLTVACTAITLMLGLGISINYSKSLGKKDYNESKKIWNNGFFLTIIVSIVTSIILIGLTYVVVPAQSKTTNIESLIKDKNLSETQISQIQQFVDFTKNESILWAQDYAAILIGFNIFNCATMVFISLLNSEGKNGIPTLFILGANVINIAIDLVLLLFTNLGVFGAGLATAISWIVSTTIFMLYINRLNKRNDTLLLYKDLNLKTFRFDKSIVIFIFAIGISSFFRNMSNSIFSMVQQSLYGSITNQITGLENSYYLTILGAVNPIYNLFYSAIIGIIRGARTVITYNYAKNNMGNVKKAYLLSICMSLIYASIFFILVCFALPQQFFWLFDVLPGSKNYNDAYQILLITMGQLILFALSVSGMLYFQSTAQPIKALITSIMYGVIIGIPGLFIGAELAKSSNNINVFVYTPIVIMAISGVIVTGYSTWHLICKHKPNKNVTDFTDKLEKYKKENNL